MKNHFFISYSGNKREEVDRIYDLMKGNIKNDTIIIEPFCGTSALSFYIYGKEKEKNLKYVLNDNNKYLIELYNLCRDEEKFKKFHDDLIKLHKKITDKIEYSKVFKKMNDDLLSYIYCHKVFTLKPGLCPLDITSDKDFKTFINAPIIDFIRNADITFHNIEGIECYNKYKDNKKAIIFLDPPYLSSYNSFYQIPDCNIYEYLYNNNINKEKAKIFLCLENNWIIRLLFKKNKKVVYDKIYKMNRRKTEHTIICN
jgi:site-specific DNA-adenine methylase